MHAMETKAIIDDNGLLTIQIPTDLNPGERSAVVVLDAHPAEWRRRKNRQSWADFPVIELGEIPKEEKISREDLY